MKKVVFSVLMTLFATIAMAQESQTEYNFLRLPVSAHAGALGGDNITRPLADVQQPGLARFGERQDHKS